MVTTNGSRRDHVDIEMSCILTVSLSVSYCEIILQFFKMLPLGETGKDDTGSLFTIS